MNSAATGLALLFFLPIGVIFGWIAHTTAARLDTRRLSLRPAVVPELDELEPAQEPRWEPSERYYDRPAHPELPAPVTVNNYFVTGASGWPTQPPVIDYAQLANRELLP